VPGLRAIQRQLAALVPEAVPPGSSADGPPLEALRDQTEPPRLISARVLEGNELRSRAVPQPSGTTFAAFLDGTQESRVAYYANGFPLILGRVAAVVRVRANRRLTTWRHALAERMYVPRRLLPDRWNAALDALQVEVVDTSTSHEGANETEHPFAVRDAAIHRVQEDRERAEQMLAAEWCAAAREPLYIDGGISANDRVATHGSVVGVVKSHRTLYAEGDALQVIFGLRAAQRTSVFRITSPKRTTVASWYLRLRDPEGRDPMWGLVRVEIAALGRATDDAMTARADEVSQWVLGEALPVALPDSRWDKMAYGIRDCEEFLRAVM
jgi:hypothetical protein